MFSSVALVMLYLAGFAATGATALALGLLVAPRIAQRGLIGFLWELLARYAAGLALLSAVVIWLGLFGAIRAATVIPIVAALAGAGAIRGRRAWRRGDLLIPPIAQPFVRVWRRLGRAERLVVAIVVAWTALLSLNVLVGAMVPDMGQDSMWYHLSIAGQWVLEGRALASPYVMPSCYPLAREAIYAALLLVGDEVLCSLLAAQVTLAMLWGMALAAGRFLGWRGGFIIAATALTYTAIMTALAPLGVKNDTLAAVLLLVVFVELVADLRAGAGGDRLSPARAALHGFLLGTASAVKLVALGYWVPLLALYLAAIVVRRRGIRRAAHVAVPLFAAAAVAYLPWAIRGFMTSGNPVFPLFASWFPVRAKYAAALAACQSNTSLHPLTWTGLAGAALAQVPHKLTIAMSNLDLMFGMVALAGLAALWRRGATWRLQGLFLLFLYLPLLMMKGGEHTLRYFAISYPMSAPAMAALLLSILDRLGPRARVALLLVLFAGGAFSYGRKQLEVAAYHTHRWPFHPLVTAAQRREYAARAETGEFYLGFEKVRPLIDRDARVLVADCWAPYYLKRRCLWGDLMIGEQLRAQWWGKPPAEARHFWDGAGIDFVLLTRPPGDDWLDRMEQDGALEAVALPGAPELRGWRLYRVWRG